jgi:uncharacterized protein
MSTSPPDFSGSLPVSEPDRGTAGPSRMQRVFLGPNGVRPGWRLAMFLLFFAVVDVLLIRGAVRLIPSFAAMLRQARSGGVLSPMFNIIVEGAQLAVALLAAGIMSRIEKRPLGAYGMPLAGAFGRLFWQGALWGLAFETAEILAIYLLGGFTFGTLALAGTALLRFAFLWAIGFVFVGMFEEFLFRGYAQVTLASGIGFWPAALLLSCVFGAIHLSNPGEGWVGALAVFAFGIFGCFTLRRTGSLWFVIGFHAASDYAETFIYSVPDSGMLATGHLLNSNLHGPRWLSGGSIGPEGSVMAFVVFAIAFAAFHKVYPAKRMETSHRAA